LPATSSPNVDPAAGFIGAIVIAAWAYSLVRDTRAVLPDMNPDQRMAERMPRWQGTTSPGTARTMAQSMRLGQCGGRVRRSGVIEEVPLAHNWRLIDFAGGAAPAIAIPWGTSLPLGSRPAFPTSRRMSQRRARQRTPAGRSFGYGPYSHRHLGRCCYNDRKPPWPSRSDHGSASRPSASSGSQ
jgi:hypothetical protein